MANITINGANYNDVPRLDVPSQSGDVSSFYEVSGTLSVTENGLFDVKDKEKVDVNVAGSAGGVNVDDVISGAYWNEKDVVYRSAEPINKYALAETNIKSFTATQSHNVYEKAFYQSQIESFTGPKVSIIDAGVFLECAHLSSISIPECIQIGYQALSSSGITEINLPACTYVDGSTFTYCMSLTRADLPKLTALSDNMFSGCKALEEVNAPMCTTINMCALQDTEKLKSFKSPCMTVAQYAFSDSSSIEYVDFTPASDISGVLNYSSFGGCTNLKTLCLRSEQTWVLMDVSCFENTPIQSGTGFIYVPKSLVEKYKVDTNWTVYADQFRALEDYTVDGTITGELDSTKI